MSDEEEDESMGDEDSSIEHDVQWEIVKNVEKMLETKFPNPKQLRASRSSDMDELCVGAAAKLVQLMELTLRAHAHTQGETSDDLIIKVSKLRFSDTLGRACCRILP